MEDYIRQYGAIMENYEGHAQVPEQKFLVNFFSKIAMLSFDAAQEVLKNQRNQFYRQFKPFRQAPHDIVHIALFPFCVAERAFYQMSFFHPKLSTRSIASLASGSSHRIPDYDKIETAIYEKRISRVIAQPVPDKLKGRQQVLALFIEEFLLVLQVRQRMTDILKEIHKRRDYISQDYAGTKAKQVEETAAMLEADHKSPILAPIKQYLNLELMIILNCMQCQSSISRLDLVSSLLYLDAATTQQRRLKHLLANKRQFHKEAQLLYWLLTYNVELIRKMRVVFSKFFYSQKMLLQTGSKPSSPSKFKQDHKADESIHSAHSSFMMGSSSESYIPDRTMSVSMSRPDPQETGVSIYNGLQGFAKKFKASVYILIHIDDFEKLECSVFKDSILQSYDYVFDSDRTLYDIHSCRHLYLDAAARNSITSFIAKVRPVLRQQHLEQEATNFVDPETFYLIKSLDLFLMLVVVLPAQTFQADEMLVKENLVRLHHALALISQHQL